MLFACNDNGTTNQTTESAKKTTTTRRTAVTTENIEPLIPPKDGIVRTYFYNSASEGGGIYTETDKRISSYFNWSETQDDSAPRRRVFNVLGQNYNGIYTKTVTFECSDLTAHEYELEGLENGAILVDVRTGEIVKYNAIPYDDKKIATEEDYLSAIEALVNNGADLSKYDYKCETQYRVISPEGSHGERADGFKICGENERLSTYYFFYNKTLEGVLLEDHVFAMFFGGKFTLEMVEFNYSPSKIASVVENIDDITKKAEELVIGRYEEKYSDEKKYSGFSVKSQQKDIFFKDDVAYVRILWLVEYVEQGLEDPCGIYVITITG